jgi:hypothetical protein
VRPNDQPRLAINRARAEIDVDAPCSGFPGIIKGVPPITAVQLIIALTADEYVVARLPTEDVGSGIADESVSKGGPVKVFDFGKRVDARTKRVLGGCKRQIY